MNFATFSNALLEIFVLWCFFWGGGYSDDGTCTLQIFSGTQHDCQVPSRNFQWRTFQQSEAKTSL